MIRIRNAEERDIPRLIELLAQVLKVHSDGRPDIFIPNTTKYSPEELALRLQNPSLPTLVAVNEEEVVQGYAMCELQEAPKSQNMTQIRTMYIDDLCVDSAARGQHVGDELYHAVLDLAKKEGCYHVTLNVWECNPGAAAFYKKEGLVPMKTMLEKILE